MNNIAIGIGSYGVSVITTMSVGNLFDRVAVIDSDRKTLDTLDIEDKIYISKRLTEEDAVERIKSKLQKTLSDSDIVFVISSPIDLPYPYILPYVVDYIKSLGIITVALVIDPHGKYERKKKNEVKHVIDILTGQVATIKIPQKHIYCYCEPNYQLYEHFMTGCEFSGHDMIFEQVEFDSWYKKSVYKEKNIEKEILVGIFCLHRLIGLLNLEYPRITNDELCRIMSIAGIVHISSASAIYKGVQNSITIAESTQHEFCNMIRSRALFNDIIKTSAHGSEGLLFLLTVPENMSKDVVANICYMLHSFSMESVCSAFTINVKKGDTKTINVILLATGADDMEKEDDAF